MNEDEDLKYRGLRATIPRQKILEIIRSHGSHLSADDIYRDLVCGNAGIGLGTVYRVLAHLEQVGLIRRNDFSGGRSVYEVNDGTGHDHIICLECGRIEEFFDNAMERRQRQIARDRGFAFEDHQLTIYGYCNRCRKSEQTSH